MAGPSGLVSVELFVREESSYGWGSLLRSPTVLVGSGVKCEVAAVEHSLRVVVGVSGGLDSEVAEHGVGLPSAEELDGVGVDIGAEQGSGPAGSERARANEMRGDTSLFLERFGAPA